MEKIIIDGGVSLNGNVEISGMKNAALPIIYGCILIKDKCVIENIPNISDVAISLDILRGMGAKIRTIDKTTIEIDCTDVVGGTSQYDLVTKMRGSYYLLGAELGRYGKAHVAFPGGCNFGDRPIDQHIKGFEALGSTVDLDRGYIDLEAPDGLHNASIFFDVSTVGATVNIMLAAATIPGLTLIDNAAKEPHIVDLANFLNTCGANIKGAGTDMIKINGVSELHGCTYAIIPDMIEAGTFMVAAAATKGNVRVNNVIPKHLESITAKLVEMGVSVEELDDAIIVKSNKKLNKSNIKTLPYPGFPTDMQPQMSTLLCLADGVSYVSEGIYDTRFRYVEELRRMGAQIKVDGKTAIIEGGMPLSGAPVKAVDMRAGIALVIAGLIAHGRTEVSDIMYIERGYEDIVGKLRGLGARIQKIYSPDPESVDLKKAN